VEYTADRIAFAKRVLSNPPRVHPLMPSGGVWMTDEDCYLFLAEHCGPSSTTLETGLGISTVLFTGWGCQHTCVVPDQDEADRLLAYCTSEDINVDRLLLRVAPSDVELPRQDDSLLDLVFLDGGHEFPIPAIDWYYAGRRLRDGGKLVVDDVQLPGLYRGLLPFLDADPRWKLLNATPKWRAYEHRASGPVRDGWQDQAFFGPVRHAESFATHAVRRARRPVGRIIRFLRNKA
jgi:hypothetical protein